MRFVVGWFLGPGQGPLQGRSGCNPSQGGPLGASMGPRLFMCRQAGGLCSAALKSGLLSGGATDPNARSRSRAAGNPPAIRRSHWAHRACCLCSGVVAQSVCGAQFFFLHQKVPFCEGTAVVLGKVSPKWPEGPANRPWWSSGVPLRPMGGGIDHVTPDIHFLEKKNIWA